MIAQSPHRHSLEILETRIAPASTAIASAQFLAASVGGFTVVQAGQGLGTSGDNSGTYLLYVEKGTAVVFTTDLNNNGAVDFNEITGISAGDGLRLISFVDINGDIVTNLDSNGTLSDSNNNSTGDDPILQGDGRVLNNSRIEKIELRSLTVNDLRDQNGDGIVDDQDVALRLALSSYSIFGQILAGKGFGVSGDSSSGLVINSTGAALQQQQFTGLGNDAFTAFTPQIASIRTGSAASYEYFSFGASNKNDIQGIISNFSVPVGQSGGDIVGIRAATATTNFSIDALIAGDGGTSARGGNIQDVTLRGDDSGGYRIIAGGGGDGPNGGAGGSIINFQDLGSTTSRIEIKSGDGGTASTGGGGVGGAVSFGTLNVNGGLGITLGSGGNGFVSGGNGASLAKAVITTPEGAIDHALTVISSTRDVGHDPFTGLALNFSPDTRQYVNTEIGRKNIVDFDHDGFGDAVFSSDAPHQLVVVFGDGFGGIRADRIYLDSPAQADAITVADFNGDGFLDIATASNDPGNFDGIRVFLGKTEDRNGDGQLGQGEDLNGNRSVDFVGFKSALHSTLPSLAAGDPDGGVVVSSFYSAYRGAVAVNDIEAGDFNGDGFMDLAVGAQYLVPTVNGPAPTNFVVFLTAEIENGRPTGQFYADVGTKASGEPPAGANPAVPFVRLGNGAKTVLEATALTTSSTHDVIVGGRTSDQNGGSRSVLTIDNFSPSIFGPVQIVSPLGRVDTNRLIGVDKISSVNAELRDLTIVDQNTDGIADIAVVIDEPGFVVAKLGNGLSFPIFTTTGSGNTTGDNAGLYFGRPNGFALPTILVGVRAVDADGDGNTDQIAVLNYGTPGRAYEVDLVDLSDTQPIGIVTNPGGTLTGSLIGLGYSVAETINVVAFDTWITDINAPTQADFLASLANQFIASSNAFQLIDLAEHSVKITAGSGGNALIGKGGIGGTLGGALTRSAGIDPITGLPGTVVDGSISITLPTNRVYAGTLELTGGDGGSGLTAGGAGGGVRGTTVRFAPLTVNYHTLSSLIGGDGGFGVSGVGGAGGSLIGNSIEIGTSFVAGDGGRGLLGGNGGSIVGNGIGNGGVRVFDSRTLEETLIAGAGGDGVRKGGDGGDILNFAGRFDLNAVGSTFGILSHTGGNGGNAVSGAGGRGGSVINSSPVDGENNLAGDILLQGGKGGNGTSGGAGGSVSTFVNRPGQQENPAVLSFIAGDGGKGNSGVGGKGGSVTGIETPSIGKINPFAGVATNYTFNRILAGNGGGSSAGTGGAGGDISKIISSNSDNPFVLAAGAGGTGLSKGGAGG